jgi:hypothetical protein
MKKIIIAGSGPVGSFMAVICGLVGFEVVVYEKRSEFTRNIILKIEKDFFKSVQEIISRLNIQSDFFEKLNDFLCEHNDKILLNHIEKKFTTKAKAIGVKYITKEVIKFQELLKENSDMNAIVLDCTGKNSEIRKNEFGPDRIILVDTPLQHAMYINFKAKINDKSLSLYQAMKYIKNIKLTEIVLSKDIDENGFSHVTIPVFINESLAKTFDRDFPRINRNPLNPFNSPTPVSDEIFNTISALIGNLIVDGCAIDLNSVLVKKIVISCGFAKARSRTNLVCLGDSAVYLAFFRSLNLGLKHALELFIKLAMFREHDLNVFYVLQQFKLKNPLLNPIKAIATKAKNIFLIVTKVLRFGCYSFNLTTQTTERLTNVFGVTENEISSVLNRLNETCETWSLSLANFEAKRDEDIKHEIKTNKEKSLVFNYAAWFINLNGKSFIKISELTRLVSGKAALLPEDFSFMLTIFKARRETSNDSLKTIQKLVSFVKFDFMFDAISKNCLNERVTFEEKIRETHNTFAVFPFSKKQNTKAHDRTLNFHKQFISALIKNELENFKKLFSPENLTIDLINFSNDLM